MRAIIEGKKYMAVACCVLLCVACSGLEQEQDLSYGKVSFSMTRDLGGEEDIPDLSDFHIHLYNQGTVPGFPKPFQGKYSLLPDEFTLPAADGYVIDAESCTLTEAVTANEGWGQRRFAGSSGTFEVIALQDKSVEFNCFMTNARVTVGYTPSFAHKFLSYKVRVTTALATETDDEGNEVVTEERTLVYDEEATQEAPRGYFNIPEGESDVKLIVEVTAMNFWWEEIIQKETYYIEAAQHLHVTFKTPADVAEEGDANGDNGGTRSSTSTAEQVYKTEIIL